MTRRPLDRIAALAQTVAVIAAVSAAGAAPRTTLVACAPGYPGDTAQAQPSMDDLAAAIRHAAGWKDRELGAVYHNNVEPGLAALAGPDAALALVPLPFFLEYRERLDLRPRLLVEQDVGLEERWTLVLPAAAAAAPAALAGWQLAGTPAYSERFVENVALAGWGPLPDTVELRFTSRVLSYLRKAARGERVAVLLDGAQTAALERLPFAGDLRIAVTSRAVPTSLLCSVGDRLPAEELRRLDAALLGLHGDDAGKALLGSLRLVRFHPLPGGKLESLATAFAGSGD